MKRIDLTGQRFGKLTVIQYDHTKKPSGRAYWLCKCDCGKKTIVEANHLRSEHTQSCGCWHKERLMESNLGNTRGRKFKDPKIASAKRIWEMSYDDGCSFDVFLRLSQEPCYYCGAGASNTYNAYIAKDGRVKNTDVNVEWAKNAFFKYNGLDRVDPSRDHSEDNVVPCCIACNIAKHNMTMEQFTDWAGRLIKTLIKRKLVFWKNIL